MILYKVLVQISLTSITTPSFSFSCSLIYIHVYRWGRQWGCLCFLLDSAVGWSWRARSVSMALSQSGMQHGIQTGQNSNSHSRPSYLQTLRPCNFLQVFVDYAWIPLSCITNIKVHPPPFWYLGLFPLQILRSPSPLQILRFTPPSDIKVTLPPLEIKVHPPSDIKVHPVFWYFLFISLLSAMHRAFPLDMAGFAINVQKILDKPDVRVGLEENGKPTRRGYLETSFLEKFATRKTVECRGITNEV